MDTRCFLCLVILANFIRESSTDFELRQTHSTRNLSRKKRYLIFPQGSSLQLIFCWVVPIIGMPNIFTMGLTAAVAWELPTKPEDVLRKKIPDDSGTRRVDKPTQKTPVIHDSHFYSPVKYNKIYNEGFYDAKGPPRNSIVRYRNPTYYAAMWGSPSLRNALRRKYGVKWSQMREDYNDRNYDEYYYRNPVYEEIHKRTRRDFFEKVEKILFSKDLDGKACVFKMICKMSNIAANEKGTFSEEILKTIFRIRSYHYIEKDNYDMAGQVSNNCTEMYPTCNLY